MVRLSALKQERSPAMLLLLSSPLVLRSATKPLPQGTSCCSYRGCGSPLGLAQHGCSPAPPLEECAAPSSSWGGRTKRHSTMPGLDWALVSGRCQPTPASLTLSHHHDPVDGMQSLCRRTADVVVLLSTAQGEAPHQLPQEWHRLRLEGAKVDRARSVSGQVLGVRGWTAVAWLS